MPFADYLAVDALSKSGMMEFAISPAQFRHGPPKVQTAAMRKGSAADALWLEGADVFASKFCEMPSDIKVKRGKVWDAFQASLGPGMDVLTAKEWDTAHRIAGALDRHEEASEIKARCNSQVSLLWINQWGMDCKARPDLMTVESSDAGDLLADLKVTNDVSPDAFAKSLGNFRYHWQGEHYLSGAVACTGRLFERFVFICVRGERVHSVECYELAPMAIELASKELAELQRRHAALSKIDRWPASSGKRSHEQLIDVPGYYRHRAEQEMQG
jgi:hypothetical protein